MTQMQKEGAAPATERAEQILNRAGEQLGRLVGQAGLRLRQAAQAFREEADRMDELGAGAVRPEGGKAAAMQPHTERAEELVDQLGQRLGHWATVNGLQARRMMGRLREDAEDIWVEAQDIRAGWRSRRGPA